MTWWRFWKGDAADQASTTPDRAEAPSGLRLPPHARIAPSGPSDDQVKSRRLAEVRRRRQDARFDVEQGELAQAEDNPWSERIELLTGALADIEADRGRLEIDPTIPPLPLPETPIERVVARD